MNPQMINTLFNVIKSRGINIPQNVDMNNPDAIIDYLLKNGKISQDQYNRAYMQYKNMVGNNSR